MYIVEKESSIIRVWGKWRGNWNSSTKGCKQANEEGWIKDAIKAIKENSKEIRIWIRKWERWRYHIDCTSLKESAIKKSCKKAIKGIFWGFGRVRIRGRSEA